MPKPKLRLAKPAQPTGEGSALADLPDLELVERCQEELPYRTEAFTELARRHEPKVYGTALRYLGNQADAEDATQDVFLRVFNALPRFEGRSEFSTWLFRIVQNVCATRFGKRKRRHTHRDELMSSGQFPGATDPRPELIERLAGSDPAVAAALAMLSETDREVLVLRFVSELSVEQLAETLGLKQSAAKMRLKRARERFAEGHKKARDQV